MLNQLKYYVSVVENESFTKAAKQCHISQPAISQQIVALEKELGIPLLVRKGHSFSLTQAGHYYYLKAKEMLQEYEKVQQQTIRIANHQSEMLRMGYLRGLECSAVHQALVDFRKQFPDLNLSLKEGNHEELYEGLKSGKLDLVISDQRRAFSQNYVNDFLVRWPFELEMRQDHPLAGKEKITLEDLKAYPCLLVSSPSACFSEEEYYREIVGVGGEISFCQSLQEARKNVMVSDGIVLIEKQDETVPDHLLRRILYRKNSPMYRKYHTFWKKDNSGYFIEDLAERIKEAFH